MERNVPALTERTYDVLVVGGGIYGAWAAWEAARRGLAVAAVERGDFGRATSANNLRVVHGGIRYVQHLDFRRMGASIRERARLLRAAPHLVHPLPCVVPTYGRGLRGRLALRLALAAADAVGWDRNRGLPPEKRLPPGRLLSRREVREAIPGVPPAGLTGGALWYDALVVNPERLVLALFRGAAAAGAQVANYVAAERLLVEGRRVVGVAARDLVTGDTFPLRARVTLNLCGPWVDRLLAAGFPRPLPRLFPFSQAWNLVLRRSLGPAHAFGLPSPRRVHDPDRRIAHQTRFVFFVPWRGVTLVGTSHRPPPKSAPEMTCDPAEVEDLLAEARAAYPAAALTPADVVDAFGGLLPGEVDPRTGGVRLRKHPVVRDHGEADGVGGLVSAVGVKLTTARRVAEGVVDRAAAQLGAGTGGESPAAALVPGAPTEGWGAFLRTALGERPPGLPEPLFRRLLEDHGTAWRRVLALAREGPEGLGVLPGTEVLAAEVRYAAREEMVVHLLDVVRRRTDLGKRGPPPQAALRRAAAIVAQELGWSPARRAAEEEAVAAAYRAAGEVGRSRAARQ